ncbi:MAG: flagellar biosynthetic protein FliO [Herminiimonas sp.]|nr:flagellar biosynthetic protein FliO [Herminiimonas sp.]
MMALHSNNRRRGMVARFAAVIGTALLPCSLALAAAETGVPTTMAVPAVTAAPATTADLAAAPTTAPAIPAPVTAAPTPVIVPPGQFVTPRSPPAPAAPSGSAATAAVASAAGLTQVAMVLVLVVAMIAAVAWLMRRLGMARTMGGSTIRIISGVNLSNRERILVVEIADQWIVVGVTASNINTLATMPRQDSTVGTPGMTTSGGKNFALWLKQTIDKRNRAASNNGSTNGN